ncbi:MAG TPA: hypothetical protein VFN23_12265, partial [Ktedonobacteraceae bacterium]|nr:hypothetical protein [Ktedonobacteraceae bacterium]
VSLSLFAFGVYLVSFYQSLHLVGTSIAEAQLIAQSALTTFAVCSGLLLIPFVVPPAKFWVGGSKLSGDWRPTLLAAVLLLVFLGVLAIEPLRTFFSLAALHPIDYLLIGAAALIWSVLQRWIWRAHLLERFLHIRWEDET